MFWIIWNLLFYTFIFQNILITQGYDEFCNEPFDEIYCSCEVSYLHTTMACYILADMEENHNRWDNMSSVDNVVNLKLIASVHAVRFSKMPSVQLKQMKYLENLDVQQANLTELKSYAISDLKVLRDLKLDNCEISELQQNAISNLPRLKELSLSDNLIQEIRADVLTGLLGLEKLHLDRNRISRIESCAFCDLQNLSELNLWQNEIEDLTEYIFRGLRFLKRLDLSSNKIRILNDKVFHSLPKLDELDLQSNLIYHIGPRAFHGLEKMQNLNLKSNKIKMLPDTVFEFLPTLRSVDLDKNELVTLQEQVLKHMDKIKDPHLFVHVKSNPFICDCRLHWVKPFIKLNYSQYFIEELKQLQCKTEDEKLQPVHKIKMDCKSFTNQQKTTTTTPRPIVKQSEDLVPYEIQKVKNMTTSSDREVDIENGDIVQDSEAIEKSNEIMDSGSSGTRPVVADFNLILFVTLLSLFLVRKRKGTCF